MKFKSSIVLAAVLAALCLGYWLMTVAEDVKRQYKEQVDAAQRSIFPFEANAVRMLRIEREHEAPGENVR